MPDHPNRRSEIIRRIFAYLLMTAIAAVVISFAILRMSGYSFSWHNGFSIAKVGVIRVQSEPPGATVTVDDAVQKDKTKTQIELPEGEHKLDLNLEGYRPWSAAFDLPASGFKDLDYALLIPDVLTERTYGLTGEPSKVTSAKMTPDGTHLLLQLPDNRWQIYLTSAGSNSFDPTLNFDLPGVTNLGSKAALENISFEIVDVSLDSKAFLIKRSDSSYFVVELPSAFGRTKITPLEFNQSSRVEFDHANSNYVYQLTNSGNLNRVEIDNSKSTLESQNIASFVQYQHRLVVLSFDRRASEHILLPLPNWREIADDADELLALSDKHLVYRDNQEIKILLNYESGERKSEVTGQYALADSQTTLWMGPKAETIAFEDGDNGLVTYNFEDGVFYPLKASANAVPSFVDTHHLAIGNQLLDFDGNNPYDLTNTFGAVDKVIGIAGPRLFYLRDNVLCSYWLVA